MTDVQELVERIKAAAAEEGFQRAGIASAKSVPAEAASRFAQWLGEGLHGQMTYMARNVDVRLDPRKLLDGAASVICLAADYTLAGGSSAGVPAQTAPSESHAMAWMARYTQGRDYHKVLKQRCIRLMDRIRNLAPAFQGRAFVDSAPVMERTLAVQAGLGWIGRNGCLIVPGVGSYVLLAEIVCNLDLSADAPRAGGCGECGRCAEACPTGAIRPDGLVDARRCISYLTIEHSGSIEPDLRHRMGCRLVGCDACQEACPHNARSDGLQGSSPAPWPLENVLRWTVEDWDAATRGSAARRVNYEMFLRNAVIAAGNSADASLRTALKSLLQGHCVDEGLIDWALERLRYNPNG